MVNAIKALFSHADGVHRASGLDTLSEVMEDFSYTEADCGA